MGFKAIRVVLLLNLALVFVFAACAAPGPQCVNYGKLPVCDLFLDYYTQYRGGVVMGYPVTPKVRRGDMYMQYFENVVIQYPVKAAQYENVRLRPLGIQFSEPTPYESPLHDPGCVYFARQGHHVCSAFYDYFALNGGEALFGQPTSNVIVENGIKTQYFENAKFKWVTDQSAPHVELEPWGELACRQEYLDRNMCSSNSYDGYGEMARPRTGASPDDRAELDIDRFVALHGGSSVFGEEINSLVFAGDVAYQYYRNACLMLKPGSGEPVSLAPLGKLDAPQVAPVEAFTPSDDVLYFPETGHSIILAFRDYYEQHGGRPVFGLPLTEFMEEGGLWFQWFENARFEWRPDLPNGQRVQLTRLGEINHQRFKGALPIEQVAEEPVDISTPLPQNIILRIVPKNPVLPVGENQTVTLLTHDPAGRPLRDIVVTLYTTTSASQQLLVALPTNTNGTMVVDLGPVVGDCTEVVQLRAVTETANSTAFANGQFTLWCAPE